MKKSISLGNELKVRTNIWISIICIFTYIHNVNTTCVLKSIFEAFKSMSIFYKMYGRLRFMESM